MKNSNHTVIAKTFTSDTRGVALIEFALIVPILAMMLVGSIELSNYMLFNEKMESSTTQTLGVINQYNSIDKELLDEMFAAFDTMMEPAIVTNKRIIITQIKRPSAPENCKPVVTWQYPRGGSKIGSVGEYATTGGITLAAGDSIIAIEVSGSYSLLLDAPLARGLIGGDLDLYKRRFERPRYGSFNIDPVTDQVALVPCKP